MITIECFNGLPLEYESFLIEKYDSMFINCRYIEIYYPACDINYMLVYHDHNLIDLMIFANKGKTSTCLNLLANIDQNIIRKFVEKVFEKYPLIQKIEIGASYKSYSLRKSIIVSKTNDYILKLPMTMDDYYQALGQRTRKGIRNHQSKLLRDYPNVKFVTKFGNEIEKGIVDKIIQLNKDRMKHKGIIFGKTVTEMNNIYEYSRHYGCVVYIEIDGIIIAGRIAYLLNKQIFGHVIAHDNNFSKYNLGQVCTFYSIQTSIEKGFSAFHFLWGGNEFKQSLKAEPYPLFSHLS